MSMNMTTWPHTYWWLFHFSCFFLVIEEVVGESHVEFLGGRDWLIPLNSQKLDVRCSACVCKMYYMVCFPHYWCIIASCSATSKKPQLSSAINLLFQSPRWQHLTFRPQYLLTVIKCVFYGNFACAFNAERVLCVLEAPDSSLLALSLPESWCQSTSRDGPMAWLHIRQHLAFTHSHKTKPRAVWDTNNKKYYSYRLNQSDG